MLRRIRLHTLLTKLGIGVLALATLSAFAVLTGYALTPAEPQYARTSVADEDSAKYAGGGTSLVDEVALAQGQIDSWLSRTESVDPVVALISDLSYSTSDASPASYVIADDLTTQLSADRVTAEGLLSSTASDRISYTTVVSQGGGAVRGFGGSLGGGGGSFGGLSGGGGGGSMAGMGGLEASNPSGVATSLDNSIAALSSGDSGASSGGSAGDNSQGNNSQGNANPSPGSSNGNSTDSSNNGKSADAPANGKNGTTPNGKGPATGTVTGLPNGGGSNGTGTPVQQVPEPSSVLLMALGLGAITVARRRRG
jgi:hypothetical protein